MAKDSSSDPKVPEDPSTEEARSSDPRDVIDTQEEGALSSAEQIGQPEPMIEGVDPLLIPEVQALASRVGGLRKLREIVEVLISRGD